MRWAEKSFCPAPSMAVARASNPATNRLSFFNRDRNFRSGFAFVLAGVRLKCRSINFDAAAWRLLSSTSQRCWRSFRSADATASATVNVSGLTPPRSSAIFTSSSLLSRDASHQHVFHFVSILFQQQSNNVDVIAIERPRHRRRLVESVFHFHVRATIEQHLRRPPHCRVQQP